MGTKDIEIIATHNGPFHADDAVGVAIVSRLAGDCQVRRTRDDDAVADADVAIDVGGQHDPTEGRFDHHQKNGAGARPNGTPYASAGLVWAEYGKDFVEWELGEDVDAAAIARRVDKKIIQGIDALDTGYDQPVSEEGVEHVTLSRVISAMNPSWNEDEGFFRPFLEAVGLAESVLRRAVRQADAFLEAKAVVEQGERVALDDAHDAIVLGQWAPWKEHVHEICDDLPAFTVYPQDGEWMVMQVPEAPDSFRPAYRGLPEAYQGLRGDDLIEESGVADAVFVHPGRFCGGAESKAGAIELARHAFTQ